MAIVMSDYRKKQVEDFHVLVWSGYPKAFARPNGSGHVPLKMGMVDDLRAAFPDIEKSVVETFMEVYTSSEEYRRKCAVVGTPRVSLTGERKGVVSESQATSARRSLGERKGGAAQGILSVCPKTGKLGYLTGGDALESARSARHGMHQNTEAAAFRCQHCDRFHWGHKKPWSYMPRAMRAEMVEARRHA